MWNQILQQFKYNPFLFSTLSSELDSVPSNFIFVIFFLFNIRMANTDLLGYAKAIHIIAIIECVIYCLTIVGLIFLYFPIIGMRICKKWDVSEAKYVGLDCLMLS